MPEARAIVRGQSVTTELKAQAVGGGRGPGAAGRVRAAEAAAGRVRAIIAS